MTGNAGIFAAAYGEGTAAATASAALKQYATKNAVDAVRAVHFVVIFYRKTVDDLPTDSRTTICRALTKTMCFVLDAGCNCAARTARRAPSAKDAAAAKRPQQQKQQQQQQHCH